MLNKRIISLIGILTVAFSLSLQAQESIVRGTVTDSGGPVSGAAVMCGNSGAVTDLDGNFSISVAPDAVLNISCLGYKTVSVPVNGRAVVAVVLETDSTFLEDAVVVGYGTQKKSNLTGAVSVIKSDNIKDRSALDLGHMLQGSVAGLNITSASGRPGQSASLNIRGLNSINSSSPLVLVDGVESDIQYVNPADVESVSVIKDAAAAAIYGSKGSAGVIIITTKNGSKEKDGKATVSYSGRFGFTAPTASTDWEDRGYYHVYLSNLFMKTYNGGDVYPYTEEDMQELWIRRDDKVENPERPWVIIKQDASGNDIYEYYGNTDWYHTFFRDIKPTTSHTITASGATEHVNYLISGGFQREEGMFNINSDVYTRYNVRAKVGFDVNKWLRIGNNFSFFNSSYFYPGVGGINNSLYNATAYCTPAIPAFNPDGSLVYTALKNASGKNNVLLSFYNGDRNTDRVDNLSNTTDITITPFKGFTIKGDFTYSLKIGRNSNRTVPAEYSVYPGVIEEISVGDYFENKLSESSSIATYMAANLYATYEHSFAEKHNLKLMAGVNFDHRHIKNTGAVGYNLYSTDLDDLNLTGVDEATGEKRTEATGGQNEYKTAGYFARINYDYEGKYLLELNGRYDGSSRFLRGSRWVFSPSVSAGWRISEEPFFAPVRGWWDNLKLRASFGQLGNQQMSAYYPAIRTISTGSLSNYLLGGGQQAVASISAPVSSGLTWERSIQTNVGVDMAFFQGRLDFTAEGYIRDTKDMLTAGEALPATYGYSTAPQENVADLRTYGYELSIGWKDEFQLAGRPFFYSANFVFSDYQSYITRFNNPDKLFAKNYWEGMKYGDIYGYHILGLFESDADAAAWSAKVDQSKVNTIINASTGTKNSVTGAPGLCAGDLQFADLDGNGAIDKGKEKVGDSGDWQVIGNTQPRYNFGLNLSASWAGFDLAAFFQGIGHMDWYPQYEVRQFWGLYARPFSSFFPKDFQKDCWTEDNPDAYFPRIRGYVAGVGTGRELTSTNDRYLQNIGYLRLKNLTFGYTLPERLTKKASIDRLRIYFSGENLFYFAPGLHSKYIDPEMAMTNGNLRIYPWQKTIMFGIDITL